MYDDSFRSRYGLAPIAISCTDGPFTTFLHIHNEIEVLCILSGNSTIQIAENRFKAKKGDVFFINPLEAHSVIVDKGEAYCHKCICFDSSLIVDNSLSKGLVLGEKSIENKINLEDNDLSSLLLLLLKLYETVEAQSETLLFDTSALISTIFSLLIKNNKIHSHPYKDKTSRFCIDVIEYLSNNYSENLTSSKVAEDLFYNNSYFCRLFKANFGVKFSEYLGLYRISVSKKLLKNTNKKIIDIATECGFNSMTYFSKYFNKMEGISPIKYRKSQ